MICQLKTFRAILRSAAMLALVFTAGAASSAQQTNSASGTDLSSFRIISERNIFNANRSRRGSRGGPPERQVKVESFALVGTLSSEKGEFALFDSNTSEFRKVLKSADTIGGCKIAAIGVNNVKLECNGKTVDLPVGSQLRREDEGEWSVSARTGSFESSGRSSSTTTSTSATSTSPTAATASPGASADDNEVLKRLMQKREQELKNEK